MEKAKNKILKFFPKALSFHNPPFSPSRFSGPIVSLFPREARRPPHTPQEPSSPKVSCFGQIKHRHTNNTKAKDDKLINQEEQHQQTTRRRRRTRRLPSKDSKKNEEEGERMSAEGNAPALGHMRRFASSRSSLSNFDWTAQVAPGEEEVEEEVEVDRMAFSGPLGEGVGLMPKKEINLWKRRTMEPPPPLDLGPPHSDP